jgi:hypothetical protein
MTSFTADASQLCDPKLKVQHFAFFTDTVLLQIAFADALTSESIVLLMACLMFSSNSLVTVFPLLPNNAPPRIPNPIARNGSTIRFKRKREKKKGELRR